MSSDMLESQYRNKAAFFFIDVDNFKTGRTGRRGEQKEVSSMLQNDTISIPTA